MADSGLLASPLLTPVTQQYPEVFRVVSPAQVLRGFGAVLQGEKSSKFHVPLAESKSAPVGQSTMSPVVYASTASGASSLMCSSASLTSTKQTGGASPCVRSSMSHTRSANTAGMSAEDFARADALWRRASVATRADVFISHVWGVPRWKKALGLYYYLNVDSAMAIALTTWSALLAGLLLQNGLTAMGGMECLVPLLVYVPTAVFFLALFSAHLLRPNLRLWLDKLCIHQADETLKALGMESMMEIVQCSDRMCILWDESYFERLWCNAEVATFSATHGGPASVDFVPLWLPPWVVTAMLLDILCSSLMARLAWVSPAIAELLTSWFGPHLWALCLAAPCIGVVQWGVSYLPLLVPNYSALTTKIRQHRAMFQQLRSFRHSEAKCTVESDRKFIGEHIAGLFCQDGDSQEEAIARFDRFVNTEFSAMVEAKVSAAAKLPKREAFLVVLPLIFTSSAIVLGCDGAPCSLSAQAEVPPPPPWYDQLTEYMIVNSATYTFGALLAYPAVYPLIMCLVERAMRVQRRHIRAPLLVVCIVAGYCWAGLSVGVTCALMLYATKFGGIHVLVAALYVALQAFFFCRITQAGAPARGREGA